jgi:O-acetylserine/cysteine efflux transporter
LALSCIFDGPEAILFSLQHLSWLAIGSIFYITYLSTLFAYAVWSFLLHKYPLQTIAPFSLLVPVVAIASAVIVLGEALQSWKIFAGILIIVGLCINLLGPRLSGKRG